MSNYRFSWLIATLLILLPLAQAIAQTRAEFDSHPLRPADTSSPRDTLNSFLAYSNEAIEAWRSGQSVDVRMNLFERVAETIDLSDLAAHDLLAERVKSALLLKEILDRIDLPPNAIIPGDEEIAESQDRLTSWRIPDTAITIAKVDEGPQAGEFLFSAETVARLKQYYDQVKRLPYKSDSTPGIYEEFLHSPGALVPTSWAAALPAWSMHVVLGEALWQWITLAVVMAIAAPLIWVLLTVGRRWDKRQKTIRDSSRCGMPAAVLLSTLVLIACRFVLQYGAKLSSELWVVLSYTLWLLIFTGIGWLVFLSASRLADAINKTRDATRSSIDAQLVRTILRLVSLLMVALLAIYAADFLGVPVTPVVASLGVGGLAIALAIRPTLENIIGGLTLFADKPVKIGDYCQFGDDYGTVEEIGLRSTRLRKLDDTLVSVPNADFSQRELTNFSKRRQRLYRTTLALRYETTPEQLRGVVAKLRDMLIDHPKVAPNLLHVRFDSLGVYSLDIEVFAYVGAHDWLEYREIREDINFRIIDIVNEAGASFAFPSQTNYIGLDTSLDPEQTGEAAANVRKWHSRGELPLLDPDKGTRL